MPDELFRINEPLIAAQVIEGEAVLINFETGSYYSARGIGAEIIDLMRAPRSMAEITGAITNGDPAQNQLLGARVSGFIGKLLDENLAVSHDEGSEVQGGPESSLADENGQFCDPVDIPALDKFTDLEDLLLLDPIHDADVAGWPIARPEDEGPNR
ncbi:PqqD family protein [Gemmatimonadota bacterium]